MVGTLRVSRASRLALGPIQLISGFLSPGRFNSRVVRLAAYRHVVPKSSAMLHISIKNGAVLNLLKPTGHVMNQQFNIQQLYALPTLNLCVLYLSENKQRLVQLTA